MKFASPVFTISIFLSAILFFACSTKKTPFISKDAALWMDAVPPDMSSRVHTLYLIGDAGELDNEKDSSNYVVQGMTSIMDKKDKNSSVVYLGDNVYPAGLADEKDVTLRKEGQQILYAQLHPLKDFQGETYMIPGNHDWNKSKAGGLNAIKRQEAYVESKFGKNNNFHFYPNNGCGDPEVVKINKEVVYIFVDSQWWLQNWDNEKMMNHGCEIKSRGDFLARMEELFLEYKNKEIICMLHHPIKSNGNHGGYFSFQQHLFPLAELGVWLPLPVIGSIYPIYRQTIGDKQDNTNFENQKLTRGLETLAKKWSIDVVFVSGHEHGLEYFENAKIKYIVSGSGSKTNYIQAGGEALYARQARGFARIHFYENFEAWLEFFTIEGYNTEPILEYRVQLRAPMAGAEEDNIPR
jgi:predicted phosphodiesterase